MTNYYDVCNLCDYEAESEEDLIIHQKKEHNLFGTYTMGVEEE